MPTLLQQVEGRKAQENEEAEHIGDRRHEHARRHRRVEAQAVEHEGLPEAQLNLAEAAIYLALAPKSNDVIVALRDAQKDVRDHGHLRPPDALRDTSYYGARKLGRGQGYIYPHSDPTGFELDNLPDELKGRRYYRPSVSGQEKEDEDGG